VNVNWRELGDSTFPALSVARTLIVYFADAVKFDAGKAKVQAVVPVAVRNTSDALEKEVPFQ